MGGLDAGKRRPLRQRVAVPGEADPRWLDYMGRWGARSGITYGTTATALRVISAALGTEHNLIAQALLYRFAELLAPLFNEDRSGPRGPKDKGAWSGQYSGTSDALS